MTDKPDEDLVPLAIAGDEAATTELFQRHVDRLRAWAYAKLAINVRAKYSVADILQVAFAAAWRALPSFQDRGPGSFALWLNSITRRKVSDVLRAHYRRGSNPGLTQGVPDSVVDLASVRTPSVEAMEGELRRRLVHCIEELPSNQRAAARLVIGKGLSNTEAAAMLGTTEGTVRLRVKRAREQLWKCVTGDAM